MERGAFTRRGGSPPATRLFLMCLFIPTFTLLQLPEKRKCLDDEYLNEKGVCCNKCFSGYRLAGECTALGKRSNCTPCPSGQFMSKPNYAPNCRKCRSCKKNDVLVTPCQRQQDTVCRCQEGYYKSHINSETYQCLKCTACAPNEKERKTCTPENDTVCDCEDNYYRNNNKCEPCSNCTAGCESHCSATPAHTKVEASPEGCPSNIIAVGAAALVLLLVVAVVTHVVTKRLTEKRLQSSPSQSSQVSPDPSEEILIPDEEFSFEEFHLRSFKVAAISPVSECEQPSKLPDFIPLEIKIPDLIYSILDLVPVLQVKQLARSLGVKDMEIEQVELDHRSCREAHYQMLRAWAERGSRAGALLHPPLLQELLNELRRMHLEQAAEELENSYGIK